jgi:hypothetical protein
MNDLALFATLVGVVFLAGAVAGLNIGFALGRRRLR